MLGFLPIPDEVLAKGSCLNVETPGCDEDLDKRRWCFIIAGYPRIPVRFDSKWVLPVMVLMLIPCPWGLNFWMHQMPPSFQPRTEWCGKRPPPVSLLPRCLRRHLPIVSSKCWTRRGKLKRMMSHYQRHLRFDSVRVIAREYCMWIQVVFYTLEPCGS